MTDDIVVRLRFGQPPQQACPCVRCEAAAEIERLRLREQQLKAALAEMHGLTKQLYDVAVRA